MHRVLSLLVASHGLHAPPAHAQRWQLDLSGASVRYDSGASLASVVAAPTLEWRGERGDRFYGLVNAALAASEGSQWSAQSRGDVSLLLGSGRAGRPGIELAANAAGSVHSSGHGTAATRAEFRAHLSEHDHGMWIGGYGAGGRASGVDDAVVVWGPTVGGWARWRAWNGVVAWTPFRHQGSWISELNSQVSASLDRVDLTASGGWRASTGTDGALKDDVWAAASAAIWLTRGGGAAVVVAGGSYPLDPIQALPRGRYLSLALRLSSPRRPSPWKAPIDARAVYAAEPGGTELRFSVPGASQVAVVGDWTGWQPVPLTQARDGRWVIQVRLTAGVYRFNLVVDSDRWIVPDGVAAMDDGFGGQTALVVVP